jgi:hypothetical protein
MEIPMTTHSDMLFHMGGVPVPPGIPFGIDSRVFFVAPYRTGSENGASDGNSGKTPRRALKTLSAALGKARADKNDVIFMIASGNSASETTDDLTETLTWDKDMVHLVGINADGMIGGRSRIGTQTVSISPLVNITANACHFHGVHVFHGVSADQTGLIAVQVTGDRNVFTRCHFAGGGVATTADDAGMRSLKLSGAAECLFEDCVIGLDTITRAAANAELEIDGNSTVDGCARTMFRRCVFPTYSASGANFFVIGDADGWDRFITFEDCMFINAVQSGATAMTEALSVAAGTSPSGLMLLKNCTVVGATDWEATSESGRVYIDGAAPTNNTSGLAVVVEAT